MPMLVVSSPGEPLKDANGEELKLSYENHCLGSERFGLTAICHCRPDRWDRTMRLCDVFLKGLIWLEAYEIMLRTGECLSTHLPEMPMSEEMMEKIQKSIKRQRQQFVEAIVAGIDQLMFETGCQSVEELLLSVPYTAQGQGVGQLTPLAGRKRYQKVLRTVLFLSVMFLLFYTYCPPWILGYVWPWLYCT